jgi:hypothetical protein
LEKSKDVHDRDRQNRPRQALGVYCLKHMPNDRHPIELIAMHGGAQPDDWTWLRAVKNANR